MSNRYGNGFPSGPAAAPGVVNIFATFAQNQAAILNSAGAAPSFQARYAAPVAANGAPIPMDYTTSSHSYQQASSAAAASFAPSHKPSPTSILAANPAAKSKSQPRPTPMPKPIAKPKPAVKSTSGGAAAGADYAASVLGAAMAGAATPATAALASTASSSTAATAAATPAQPTITSSTSKPVYAPPPRPAVPIANLPGGGSSSTAPIGPATNVTRSTTNANVSLIKSQPQVYEGLKCEECGPNSEVIVDPHQGVEVCTTCGLIAGTWISDESEWRTFSDRRGDDPNRVGGPEIGLLADAGLATIMGDSPNGLGSSMAKLQNKNAMSAHHRHLMDAFRKSGRISSLLSLPQSITDRANELYKRIIDSGMIKPRGSDTLIVTCLYMLCKHDGVARSLKEMTGVSEVPTKDIHRSFKEIKTFGFHKTLRQAGKKQAKAANDEDDDDDGDEQDDYKSKTTRWGNQIKLSPRLVEHAKSMAVKARDTLKKSRDPASTIGAALFVAGYFGGLEDRKQLKDISACVGINVATIRSVVADIMQNKETILPPEFQHLTIE